MRARTPPRRATRRPRASARSRPRRCRRRASGRRRQPRCGRRRLVDKHARHVADEEDPLGTEPDGERGRRLVGVDVERAPSPARAASGATTGSVRPRAPPRSAPGADGIGSPTSPSASTCVALEPDLVAEERRSPSARLRRRPRRSPRRVSSRTTSSTSAVVMRRPSTKSASIPRRSISAVICGPAPWTTTTSWPFRAPARAPRRRLRRDPAAELEHDPAHVVYSALMRT